MFNPSQQDVRKFFFTAYNKAQNQQELADIEKIAYSVILKHPEYQYIFENQDKYLDYQWLPDKGEVNPILHFCLHLTLIEQLSISSPPGINELYKQMLQKYKSPHDAEHEIIDCMAEMIWYANQNKTSPDIDIYLNCVKKKLKQL